MSAVAMQVAALLPDSKGGAAVDSPLDADPEEEEDSGLGYDETATASVRAQDASAAAAPTSGEQPQAVTSDERL